ncbi:MAG: Brix domain-containing protein [Monoraphidium minutum]|nr:MAG: Brix domain-containing protein [Monoraphidium minutum]
MAKKRKQQQEGGGKQEQRPDKEAQQQQQRPGKQRKGADGAARPAAAAAAAAPAAAAPPAAAVGAGGFKNKEKVLVLATRGIAFRFRHLMADVMELLPHSKKDVKLDTKNERAVVNEVCELKNCTSALFFEGRKRQDLYLWASKTPEGPSAKFLVQNVHTMDELKLTGNHLKGSRPVLSFDAAFDEEPHLQLLKEVFTQIFATPRRHHKSKPFFDHVISFSWADGRVWFRNYQVVLPLDKKKADPDNASLVEVGPRMALQPIRIFDGSFRGATLYENPAFVSPNVVRRMIKQRAAGKYNSKVAARGKRRQHEADNPQAPRAAFELTDVFRD